MLNQYYYFNDNYFKSLEKIENSYLAEISDENNKIIGFFYYIHFWKFYSLSFIM